MADSVYDQTLDTVATQLKTLADAVSTSLVPESAIEVRPFDWEDISAHHPGVTLRYLEGIAGEPDVLQPTNEREVNGYPCVVVCTLPKRTMRDDRAKWIHAFLQSVRRYFQSRRRLSAVSDTGTNELTTTVTEGAPSPPGSVRLDKIVHALTVWGWFIEPRTA